MRKFNIINEKGQKFSLMDSENYCFLTNPSGLGLKYKRTYSKIGYSFVKNIDQIAQQKTSATLNFKNYTNFNNFLNFIALSETLKLEYIIKINELEKNYYRDFDVESISKEEIRNCYLSSEVVLCMKSLWYEAKEIVYTISKETNEITWDFEWDAKFSGYDVRNLIYENKGHVEAPFLLEIFGGVEHPKVQILDGNNAIINELSLDDLTIEVGEKLTICTKDTDLYIYKQTAKEKINLFNTLDINKVNFFKLPLGVSQIRLSGDSDITNAKLTIYVQYLAI